MTLGCPASKQARVCLQVVTARFGCSDFPTVEGHAGDSEDVGHFLLGQTIRLA
ncbi:hypothetical protein Stsp02_76370 [Streptomyces sp. NBRC 14336]|nr:hypothetical protein Stsp02_76370 [Streptomyces sp. NBRC 14336]